MCVVSARARTTHTNTHAHSLTHAQPSNTGVLDGDYLLVFGGSNVPFGHSNTNDFFACDLKNRHWEKIEYVLASPVSRTMEIVIPKS